MVFFPVTCHLTCPVTDFINKQMTGESIFEPVRFNGWPELKEAYLSGYTPATFILAPMAMALREQGVPIKIVYLGHRDGSAVMVHKDSNIWRMEDLRGKKIAVPNRYSNQRLLIFRALKQAGMTIKDVELRGNAAAGHAGRALRQSRGRHFQRRTVHGTDRARWLWPCPLANERCVAEFHLLCPCRARRHDQEPS